MKISRLVPLFRISLFTVTLIFPSFLYPDFASYSSMFTDKFQFKTLGEENVSDELYQRMVTIFEILDIKDHTKIHVKRMSKQLRAVLDNDTFATVTHNAIYIDEDKLLKLDEERQNFLLAHEAMHIKNKDVAKGFAAWLGVAVLTSAAIYYCRNKNPLYGSLGMVALAIVQVAAVAALHRYQEQRADEGAELVVPLPAVAIDEHNHENDGALRKAWRWLRSWFDAYHPIMH